MRMERLKPAANILKVSERHISRMIKDGRWPAYRLGAKALAVDVDEIRELTRISGKPNIVEQELR